MKPGGRMVTLDGCYIQGQSRIAKALLRHDRGKFIRDVPAYLKLADEHFKDVRSDVRHDLLSLPYTLLIMTCRGQRHHAGLQV
jgi:hypothetical protein